MTHLKESVKLLAVKYYLENEVTQEEVSRAFGIYVRTFQRWLYRYRNKEYLKRKNRESVSYKIRKIHVKTALKIVTKYPHISIMESAQEKT
jgi:transposase-like protein